MDFCNFLTQTFWKFGKQKPGKFLNCWFQAQEYSQGKDHSVIAMVFIHFPQTSVTGHCQEQVILLQTFSLTQDDSFYVLINSLNPTSPTTPINPLTSFLALTCQNPRSGNSTKKIFLSLAAESSFKSNSLLSLSFFFFLSLALSAVIASLGSRALYERKDGWNLELRARWCSFKGDLRSTERFA